MRSVFENEKIKNDNKGDSNYDILEIDPNVVIHDLKMDITTRERSLIGKTAVVQREVCEDDGFGKEAFWH